MTHWLQGLDALLRAHHAPVAPAESTDPPPPDSPRRIPRRALIIITVALGSCYGFFMGWYALRTHGTSGLAQLVASTAKLPLLFILTLAVTFPSLYVFGTLMGSRLSFRQATRAVGEWIAVILAVAASLGPVLGFFTVSTESYPFIVLLNVVLLGTAGIAGCASLLRRLRGAGPERTIEGAGHGAGLVLFAWILLFGLVGVQMGWVLRPFVGSPDQPFTLLRATDSNGIAAVFRVIARVFWGA